MERRIIGDSSIDLNEELGAFMNVTKVSFPIELDGKDRLDDDNFDVARFVDEMATSPNAPRTAAPSPGAWMEAMSKGDEVFCVTISAKLSASYANAILAAKEVREEHPERRIVVFDSQSASAGETAVCAKIAALLKRGDAFNAVIAQVHDYIRRMNTFFCLEDISHLVKAGRMPRIAGAVLSRLSIKPICSGTNGEIHIEELKRGIRTALHRMAEIVAERVVDAEKKTIYIANVQARERARKIADTICRLAPFRKVEILACGGLSSAYANRNGLIIAF